jgi:hypothetical protein
LGKNQWICYVDGVGYGEIFESTEGVFNCIEQVVLYVELVWEYYLVYSGEGYGLVADDNGGGCVEFLG